MRRPPAPGSVTSSSFALGASPAAYVTALPANPVDGQEIYYAADATNGVIWHLRYRSGSSSSYKWEYVGGPPLVSEVNASGWESLASTSFVALTTGMTIIAPEKGQYCVQIGFDARPAVANSNGDPSIIWMSYKIGSTAASDDDRAWCASPSIYDYTIASVSKTRVKDLSGADTTARTLTAQFKASTASKTSYVWSRWMTIIPVRIG